MKKTIALTNYGARNKDFPFDPTAYYFVFSIVDSSLVNSPRQASATTNHVVTVSITWEVLLNWGNRYPGSFYPLRADEPDLVKLLFWYAKECIEKNVKSGRLSDKEELEITTQTAEAACPFDPSLIPDPTGYVFDVDVDSIHSPNEVQY